MEQIKILNPLGIDNWDTLLLDHEKATIFHTSFWARVLSESYGYIPIYFSVLKNSTLEAVVPCMEINSFLTSKRAVSLPFTDSCPPVFFSPGVMEDIFHFIIKTGQKYQWKSFEARDIDHKLYKCPPSCVYLNHDLDLTVGPEQLKTGLRSSTARNIKRAVKAKVHILEDNSFRGMKEFCRLNSITRKEHGLPPQPFGFFSRLHRHIIENGFGKILLAKHDGIIIAGAVFLHFNGHAIYKYGASDKRYQSIRANNLVMWEAIRRFSDDGFKSLSFGRTEFEHKGLIQFKSGWGSVESEMYYIKYSIKEQSFVKDITKTTGWHNHIFSRMPISALNIVGSILYRHIG